MPRYVHPLKTEIAADVGMSTLTRIVRLTAGLLGVSAIIGAVLVMIFAR